MGYEGSAVNVSGVFGFPSRLLQQVAETEYEVSTKWVYPVYAANPSDYDVNPPLSHF